MSNFNLKAIEFQIASEVRCDKDGKSYFSVSAVARLCGISHQALFKAFDACNIPTSKIAQMLIQHGFEAATISAFGQTGIPDIAAAVIIQYYAMFAGERCTDTAKQVTSAFLAIGIRAYGQQLSGFKNEPLDYASAVEKILEAQLPAEAKPYVVRYEKRFWDALEGCTGFSKGDIYCGKFIKTYIYKNFPDVMMERLEAINPLLDNGQRKNKHHQHFDSTLLSLLMARIELVTNLLEVSKDLKEFRRLVAKTRKIRLNEASIRALIATSAD